MDEKEKYPIFTRQFFWVVLSFYLFTRILLICFVPLLDPSEARYALIIHYMAKSDNYLEPTFVFNGHVTMFNGKPPLVFQIGASVCELMGTNLFSVRFPSLISSLFLLMFVYWTVCRLKNERAAMFSVLFCVSSVIFYLYMGLCMTDMVLTTSVTGALCSYMLFTGRKPSIQKKGFSIAFFAMLAIGMLVKGPVAIVMAGFPVFSFVLINKRWGELRDHAWILGTLVFLLIASPWYYLMARKDPGFLEYFFIHENFLRFVVHNYGDRFGSGRETFHGMAVVWLIVVTMPNLFLLWLPLRKKEERKNFFAWDQFRDPLHGLSLLTVFTITLFWSLTSRVLMTYLLPTVPFFAIFLACRMDDFGYFRQPGFLKYLRVSFPVSAILIPLGMAAATWGAVCWSDDVPSSGYKRVQQAVQEDADLRGRKFYFWGTTPFSANFYLEGQVQNHEDGSRSDGRDNGQNILWISRENLETVRPIDRQLLMKYHQWYIYRPVCPKPQK